MEWLTDGPKIQFDGCMGELLFFFFPVFFLFECPGAPDSQPDLVGVKRRCGL